MSFRRDLGNKYFSGENNSSSHFSQQSPRWYTLLALPFPDQQIGRRDLAPARPNKRHQRAGYFSNPM